MECSESKTIIDYIIVNRRLKNLLHDIKIFQGSDIGSDHFLVRVRINLLSRRKQQSNNANWQMSLYTKCTYYKKEVYEDYINKD